MPRRVSYTDRQWRNARAYHLSHEPLCRMCKAQGYIALAEVVDHITPHKGDYFLFWDTNNWQSLCKRCHDSTKQRIEGNGYTNDIGADGWPTDPKHPRNTQKNLQ